MKPEPVITLLTDFGTRDHYVASMVAVIASRTGARVVDITHEVATQDTAGAAYQLACCHRYFPPGSVHVVVVDPGVGGGRRIVAVSAGGYTYLAPDNGVLTMALEGDDCIDEAVAVTERRFFRAEVSATFHGRDIFAPVAAALFEGAPLSDLGPPAGPLVRLPQAEVRISGDEAAGAVVAVDRFGNLISSMPGGLLGGRGVRAVEVAGFQVPFARTYADVPEGQVVAYLGSGGRVEVAVRNGSAADLLGAKVGDPVRVRFSG